MNIPFLNQSHIDIAEVSALLDAKDIHFVSIATINWPDTYPYSPDVKFRLAHNGKSIIIEYIVRENYIRAMAGGDNGNVWEDSCVEMFISFDQSHYYNIECNCRGDVLLACGPDRNHRIYSTTENVSKIKRMSSIKYDSTFDNMPAPDEWKLQLIIPVDVFFKDDIEGLHSLSARANFYKCGDKLPTPHFLSWQPIDVESPDFHLPGFFGDIVFE